MGRSASRSGAARLRKCSNSRGPSGQLASWFFFLRREAGSDELLDPPGFVDGGDQAVSGAGQGAAAIDHFLKHGVEIEADADTQDGSAQPGDALLESLDLTPQLIGSIHFSTLDSLEDFAVARPGSRSVAPGFRYAHDIETLLIHCHDVIINGAFCKILQ